MVNSEFWITKEDNKNTSSVLESFKEEFKTCENKVL